MGSCLSKKCSNVSSSAPLDSTAIVAKSAPPWTNLNKGATQSGRNMAAAVEDNSIMKEVFVIKHRKSHDTRTGLTCTAPEPGKICSNAATVNVISATSAPVRKPSCSKEELDAILVQCDKVSRSISGNGKKYFGSQRSFDFDGDDDNRGRTFDDLKRGVDDPSLHGRQIRASPSPHRRRRTPSRERDQQQRSGSSERNVTGNGERRTSRSPARKRSENLPNSNATNFPGKIVTIPATVSSAGSLVMDKSNNETPLLPTTPNSATIRRVLVKRNAMSPRSQSPAKVIQSNVEIFNDNQDVPLSHQHQPSLSRSSSRKGAELSPYRRKALNEISSNSLAVPHNSNKTTNFIVPQTPKAKPNAEEPNNKTKVMAMVAMSDKALENAAEQLKPNTASIKSSLVQVGTGPETLNPPKPTRTRSSSRLSRDLAFNLEPQQNTTASTSYAALLLEDIQNFHQKNNTSMNTNNQPSFSLPRCVTKACSILDAVAELNSGTSSDRFNLPLQISTNDPFLESEFEGGEDLVEPSLHKYVTVRRGSSIGGPQIREPSSGNLTGGTYAKKTLNGEKGQKRPIVKKKRNPESQQGRIERSRRVAASI